MSQIDKYAEYLSQQAKKESVFQTKNNPNDINTRIAEATGKKIVSSPLNENSSYTPTAERSAFSGGWRAKLVGPNGKVSYLSQHAFKNKEDAVDHAQDYHNHVNAKGLNPDRMKSPDADKLVQNHPAVTSLVKQGYKVEDRDDHFIVLSDPKNKNHKVMIPHSEEGIGSKLSYHLIPGKRDDVHLYVKKGNKELSESVQLDEVFQALGAALARGVAAAAPRVASAMSKSGSAAKSVAGSLANAASEYGMVHLGRMGHINFHARLAKDEKGNFSPKVGFSAYNPQTGAMVTSDPGAYPSGRAYPTGHPFRRSMEIYDIHDDSFKSDSSETAGERTAKTQSAPSPTQTSSKPAAMKAPTQNNESVMIEVIENELIQIHDNMLNEEKIDLHERAALVGAIARMGLGLLGKALKSPKAMSALSYLAPMIAGSKPANKGEAGMPLSPQRKPTQSVTSAVPKPRQASQPKTDVATPAEKTKTKANTPQAFYNQMYSAAKSAGHKFPELTAAQAALETGWGKSMSGTNNPFGQKGKPGRDPVTYKKTWEVEGGRKVTRREPFKNYESLEDAMKDRAVKWETRMKGAKDPYQAIDMIAGRYATDPNYSRKIKTIMKTYSKNVGSN